MSNSSGKAIVEQFMADNDRLLKAADSLAALWPVGANVNAESLRGLRMALAEFRTQLQVHFAEEEQSGYLGEALSAAPQLASQAESLRHEHEAFMAAADRLVAEVEEDVPDADQAAKQRQKFVQLVSGLRKHEQAENSLVLEAFDEDLGSGD